MNHPAVSIISIGFGLVGILAAAVMAVIHHRRQAVPNAPHTPQPPRPPQTPPTRIQQPPINNRDCSICGDSIDPGQEQRMILCGHRFHTYCIMNWLEHSLVCPNCRMLAE